MSIMSLPISLFVPGSIFLIMILAMGMIHESKKYRADRNIALSYDLSTAVHAHAERMGYSVKKARRMDRQFRRWFVIAAASPVIIRITSRAVDEYWNTLLKVDEGNLYSQFSKAVSGRYVKHVAGVGSEDSNARAWVAYAAVWGVNPPADLFSRPSEEALQRYRKQVKVSKYGEGLNYIILNFGSSFNSGGSYSDGQYSDRVYSKAVYSEGGYPDGGCSDARMVVVEMVVKAAASV